MELSALGGSPSVPKDELTLPLTIYYAPFSTASITEAGLAALAVPCERVKLDIDAGDVIVALVDREATLKELRRR